MYSEFWPGVYKENFESWSLLRNRTIKEYSTQPRGAMYYNMHVTQLLHKIYVISNLLMQHCILPQRQKSDSVCHISLLTSCLQTKQLAEILRMSSSYLLIESLIRLNICRQSRYSLKRWKVDSLPSLVASSRPQRVRRVM